MTEDPSNISSPESVSLSTVHEQSHGTASYSDISDSLSRCYSSGVNSDEKADQETGKNLSPSDQLLLIYKKHNFSREATEDILTFLCSLNIDVPRTFYQFKKLTSSLPPEIVDFSSGKYSYFGVEEAFLYALKEKSRQSTLTTPSVSITFNVDGLPLYKSSGVAAWPLLAAFSFFDAPIPVAIFCCYGKPDVHILVDGVIKEIQALMRRGFVYKGKSYTISAVSFVCDAVARVHLQGIKSHASKIGCGYCRCVGEKLQNRVVFPSSVCDSRTDEMYMRFQENNQIFLSPLVKIVPLMTGFPIDYQHCICLGIVRRLFHFYFSSVKSFRLPCKLSFDQLKALSSECSEFAAYIPREFQRHPRRLDRDLPFFKATEFRLFLLYLGPYLFRKYLKKNYYDHFLLLHFSIYVLSSNRYFNLIDHAQSCIERFVSQMEALFGRHSVSYNFHVILHLTFFVRLHGPLDAFSTFKFENWLHLLKMRIKKTRHVAQNVVNAAFALKSEAHLNGRELFFSVNSPDNCAYVNGNFVLITAKRDTLVTGRVLCFHRPLYSYPYSSQVLKIGFYYFGRENITGTPNGKAMVIPCDKEFLVIPYCNF